MSEFDAEQLRRIGDYLGPILDAVARHRQRTKWTGPGADRFDQDLRQWQSRLHDIRDDAYAAARQAAREP